MIKTTIHSPLALLLVLLLSLTLSACGGGGTDTPTTGVASTGKLSFIYKGLTVPISGVSYTTSSSSETQITTADGTYNYNTGDIITFTLAGATYSVPAEAALSQLELAGGNPDTASNLAQLLIYTDQNQWPNDGIAYNDPSFSLDAALSSAEFTKQFYALTGIANIGKLSFMYKGQTVPISGVSYTTSSSSGTETTTADGTYNYNTGDTISFTLAGKTYSIAANTALSQLDLAGGNTDTASNLAQLLIYADQNQWPNDGIAYSDPALSLDATLSSAEFIKQFYALTGEMPPSLFTPSLGINLEAPQGEADTVGQPMPFVDLFRTARPFIDLNTDTTYATVDENGWPTTMTGADYARTKLLQGVPKNAIPDGNYTLIYDGDASRISGISITQVAPYSASNGLSGRTVTLALQDGISNELNIQALPGTTSISFIMPGGTCKNDSTGNYNHFIRVESQAECPSNTSYVSFVDRLSANRNEIIFNPEYLTFLKDFKVLRMMNFMEASPSSSACKDENNIIDETCVVTQTRPWADRAKLDHAVWGGSSRTPEEFRKGVPVEVMAELANQTGTDPWFTMPYNADDEYVTEFAKLIYSNLASHLDPHIEYSNEFWNSGFMIHYFVTFKGIEAGLNTVPEEYQAYPSRDAEYFGQLRYYSQRAVQMFKLWDNAFGSDAVRLTRILGSSQGDTILTKEILNFEDAKSITDAVAVAPYFFGCTRRAACPNAPMTLAEVNTVDDVFSVMDQSKDIDPSAMEATINNINRQIQETAAAGVALVTYEGGQHLTTTLGGDVGNLSITEKETLRGLFQGANRDPRMKDRYLQLLNGWKDNAGQGAELFTLYTLPQTYYQYGNWGIKEHLGKTRAESPKYDAAMEFQETTGQCWWNGC